MWPDWVNIYFKMSIKLFLIWILPLIWFFLLGSDCSIKTHLNKLSVEKIKGYIMLTCINLKHALKYLTLGETAEILLHARMSLVNSTWSHQFSSEASYIVQGLVELIYLSIHIFWKFTKKKVIKLKSFRVLTHFTPETSF